MNAPVRRTTYPTYVPHPETSVSRLHAGLPGDFGSPLRGVVTAPTPITPQAGFPTARAPEALWIPRPTRPPQARRTRLVQQHNGLLIEIPATQRSARTTALRVVSVLARATGRVTMIGLMLSGPIVGLLFASWMGFSLPN